MKTFAVGFLFYLHCNVATGSSASDYLGVGYNILKANPDGYNWTTPDLDPGLLMSRRILETDISSQHFVQSQEYPVCTPASTTSVFHDPKSYQEYLRHFVSMDERKVSTISHYSFTDSQLYKDIKQKMLSNHDVFRDDITACPTTHARYTIPFEHMNKNLVTPKFARDVCNLPIAYDRDSYKQFLDAWGTHVTMEVVLGKRSGTRYRLSVIDLAEVLLTSYESDVATVIMEDYEGYGTVVHLNMTHIHRSAFANLPLGTEVSNFSVGQDADAALSWKLIPISEVLSTDYWPNSNGFHSAGICSRESLNLTALKLNLENAIDSYPVTSGVGEIPQPIDIKFPITWPSGTYGLYMPETGCPNDPIKFATGYFSDDTEDDKNQNSWTPGIHIHGSLSDTNLTTYFCMKIRSSSNEYVQNWPKGNYCILKKGDCPNGFRIGALTMDDEDSRNGNRYSGVLPDGKYTDLSTIFYCCRQDGSSEVPILLPIEKPFYLQRYAGPCQKVFGMSVTDEFIYYDNEDSNNGNNCTGAHPYLEGGCKTGNLKIHFCYYDRGIPHPSPLSVSGLFG